MQNGLIWVRTLTSVAQRVNSIRISNHVDNWRVLIEKLIQLEINNWPKFQKELKNLHLAEIHQIKLKELSVNKEKNPMK